MSNLVSIATKRGPDKDIVATLEELLEMARAGEVTALAVGAFLTGGIAHTDFMGPSDELTYASCVLRARIDAYLVSLA